MSAGFIARAALAAFVLGVFVNIRWSPLGVFYAEWWAALAFFLALYAASFSRLKIYFGTGAVILSATACVSLFWIVSAGNAAYLVYLIGAFVVCCLASSTRDERIFEFCAKAVLALACLHALAGLCQMFGFETHGLVVRNTTGRVFGNINQPNHYAGLLYLGLASAAYLMSIGVLEWKFFSCLSFFMALAGVPSGSRGIVLYLTALAVAGIFFMCHAKKNQDGRYARLGQALLFVAFCSVVAQIIYPTFSGLYGSVGVTAFSRTDGSQADGQRLYNLNIALLSIKEHPFLGVGPDSFFRLSAEAMNVLPGNPATRFAEHSHNLFVQLATEFGVPLAVLVLVLGVFWVLNSGAEKRLENAWALLSVTIMGLHSMVEYPLWYAYFLLPFAFFLGVGDRNRPWLSIEVSPNAVKVVALLGLLVLAWIWRDWQVVRWVDFRLTSDEPDISLEVRDQVISELNSLSRFSVFSEYASRLRLQAWRPAHGGAAEQADQCERNWTRKPAWFQMMHCAEAYALTRREADLDTMVQAFCEGFPGKHQVFKDWARDTDAALSGSGALILSGRRCF